MDARSSDGVHPHWGLLLKLSAQFFSNLTYQGESLAFFIEMLLEYNWGGGGAQGGTIFWSSTSSKIFLISNIIYIDDVIMGLSTPGLMVINGVDYNAAKQCNPAVDVLKEGEIEIY